MKKLLTVGGVAALLMPMATFAAYVAAGPTVSVPGSMSAQNAYLVGGTVMVQSPVQGDALTAGGTVIVSSNVSKDIFAAGGTIIVVGASAEDVRIAGGNITLGANVSGEAMLAGGQVTVTADTKIAKDSYVAGGSVLFSGTENGSLTVAGGDVHIDGTVNGDLLVKQAGKITFGPRAVVKGMFEYSAPQAAEMASGAQILGQTVFHKTEARQMPQGARWAFAGFLGVWAFVKFVIMLTAAYLLWYFRRKDMGLVIESVHTKFWHELLRGFALLFLVPIAAIVLFMTVIGSIPAGMVLLVYILLLVLTGPVTFVVAASVLQKLWKKNRTELRWYHILLGGIALGVLALVPLVGWVLCFVLYLVSLGAVANALRARF